MSKYFIVAIGRSGTLWLSDILAQAAGHECHHEEMDPRSKVIPQPWSPFPLDRWRERESYGEVNGMLRYHLSAQFLGLEMEIEKRIYLRRDPQDIIASWMTQGSRHESELSATCHEVLWHAANLAAWADVSHSHVIEVESVWGNKERLQSLVNLLGLDLQVTDSMLVPCNTGNARARQSWVWTPDRLGIASMAAERVGYGLSRGPTQSAPFSF